VHLDLAHIEVAQQQLAFIRRRRLDVRVRQADAPEDSALATLTGFYGSAVAPPGSAATSWDGSGAAPGDGKGDGNGDQNAGTEGNHGVPSDTANQGNDGGAAEGDQEQPEEPVVPEPNEPPENTQ
jgi:hypothetical protein